MEHVYVVQHVHELPGDREDVKFVGVYATQEDAELAVERLKKQPGFRDCPAGFTVDRYEVGQDHWTEGFVTIQPDGND